MAKKRTPGRAQGTTYLPDHLYSVVFTVASVDSRRRARRACPAA
jgi:hypothetical protein